MVSSPRIGVLSDDSGFVDRIGEAGGKAVPVHLPERPDDWGVALAREWVSDRLEIDISFLDLDALLFDADSSEELAGALIAAVRSKIPAVCLASPMESPFAAAFAGLGVSPLDGDAVEVAVRLGREEKPRAKRLVDNFATANAARVGLTVGGGPELLVHLAAIAREANVVGFDRMLRVLAPETPVVTSVYSEWFEENGLPGVLDLIGDDLRDARTVDGGIKAHARPSDSPPEDERWRFSLVSGRASGAEAACLSPEKVSEVEGECRVFGSEEEAADAVAADEVESGSIVVVRGCGPCGAPGLRSLEELAEAIEDAEFSEEVTVFTDGLAPEEAPGTWVSLFSPEAASDGIIGRLRDGDVLKFDFQEGRILTSVEPKEFARRKKFRKGVTKAPAYAARYSRSATTALKGAYFG
ncbi:MAG: dihydroxy-acid dehydratase [Rubrobacteraceae bacterium]